MMTIGVILAGGKSVRMGKDKALLNIEDQSMLARTYQTLSKTSVSKTVISRNDGLKGHFADIIGSKGPLSGIHSIAMRFPFSNLLIVPVDLPLMHVDALQALIDKGQDTRNNVRYGKHSLPLFLHNTKTLKQTLDYTLRCTNSYSVDGFCSHFPLVELHANKQSSLFNANTPDKWRAAMQHFFPNTLKNFSEVVNEPFK